MRPTTKVVLVAIAAGALGVVSTLLTSGPGRLLHTGLGQRALNAALSAKAPAPPPGAQVAKRGETLNSMKLPDLDGVMTDVPGKYAGRPLLINIWASWCGPCLREMPELQRFSAEQAGNGVQVVGIALDDAVSVQAFLQQVRIDYPILLDTPGPADAGVRLGNPAGVLPYSVLVSADGRLLKQRFGPFDAGEVDRWADL